MSHEPESATATQLPSEAETPASSPVRWLQNFGAGFLLSGIPLLVYGSLSAEMTQGSAGGWGAGQLTIALVVPFLCGTLSLFGGRRVVRCLGNLVESAHLPF